MKLTEAYIVKLIKKSIKQFMCCCVGSTIGEGEPEGLAREGAIYIDEEAPALYYFDGTEWVVLPGGDSAITEWTTADRPDPATVGQHGHNTDLNVFEEWNGTSWEALSNYTHRKSIDMYVDSSSGSDTLTDYDYANGALFETLDGAINYAASSSATIIDITLETDAVYSNTTDLSSKKLTIECSGFNIALKNPMSFANSSVTMNRLGTMNIASGANIYLKDTSLTINGGTLQGADVTPLIVFGGVSHLNIGGTVYLETVENGVILNADSNTGETNISVSDGSIFYINSNAGEANVSLYSAYVNTIVNTIKTNSNISSLGFNNMNQDYIAIIIYSDYLQYNDNADALSNGAQLGTVYKTPDGVLHQVMASVAGGGLPFKTIMWTAYGSNASDMVVTVEYNNTGRTLSVFNTDEGFVLSGAFTQKYMVSRAGAYQSGLPFFAEKYTQGQVGLYLGTNLSDIMGDYTFNDPTAPITFEIRIYE